MHWLVHTSIQYLYSHYPNIKASCHGFLFSYLYILSTETVLLSSRVAWSLG